MVRVWTELYGGREVGKESPSPSGFLARLAKASGRIGNLQSACGGFQGVRMLDEFKDLKLLDETLDEERLERLRLVANTLGLCVMSSVKFAQGSSAIHSSTCFINLIIPNFLVCASAVEFYLADEHEAQRLEIINLLKSDRPPDNSEIMRYIRNAQGKGLLFLILLLLFILSRVVPAEPPAHLFRVAKKNDVIPQEDVKLPDINVVEGDLVFADLRKAYMAVCHYISSLHHAHRHCRILY